jgi:methylenetetrahydrofolate reductase (NADH)
LNTFRDAMRSKDFVVTATLPLTDRSDASDIRAMVAMLRDSVDALQVGGDRDAVGHIDAIAAASLVIGNGVDAVVHLDCRDRNRLALKAALLGLAATGVTSVVLSRGRKLPDTLRGKVKGVFDTKTIQLIEMAHYIGSDAALEAPPDTYIGSRVSVIRPGDDWEAREARKRIDAGARFLQAQPCLNLRMLKSYADRLVALKITHRATFVADIPVLKSTESIQRIKGHYPGARIPRRVVRRLAAARDSQEEGITVAAEALRDCAAIPGVSGANLVGADDPAVIAEVLGRAAVQGRAAAAPTGKG